MTYATYLHDVSAEAVPQVAELKVWKKIHIGVASLLTTFFSGRLQSRGFYIDPEAQNMMKKSLFRFKVILNFFLRLLDITENQLNLVVISPQELGFQDIAPYDMCCARAMKLGLELCPVDLALRLREQYTDQPEGEKLLIAMKAIHKRKHFFQIFELGHDSDGQWIRGTYGNAGSHWPLDRKLVFVLPWYLSM